MSLIRNITWGKDGLSVVILDQTRLPGEERFLTLRTRDEMQEAIGQLRVRGAPAIGIFAAFALAALAAQSQQTSPNALCAELRAHSSHLVKTRPTAVNLRAMLSRMLTFAEKNAARNVPALVDAMKEQAQAIQDEDAAACHAMAAFGLTLVKDGDGVLTHCNAGPLATSAYGTGLGPLILAAERGVTLRAYVDETRPLLQGARLTAYELMNAGVDTTLICDNMASLVMREGKINACFTGCDRVAGNGDTANKIGTSAVAILAKHYGIPFYVFCPSSTVDFDCPTGGDIEIEQRDASEIRTLFFAQPVAPPDVPCYNPAFDITDHGLITAIVTEKGILRAPYMESLAFLR